MNEHHHLEPVMPDDNSVDVVPLCDAHFESILNIQQSVLSAIAEDKRESDILDQLCKLAESLVDNSAASVMMMHNNDQLFSISSGPSIPEEGKARFVDVPVDDGYGACPAAMLSGEPAYIKDISSDRRSARALKTFQDLNVCSCWSVPVYNQEKKVIGSFALSSFEHRTPTTYHDRVMKLCSSIVSILQEKKALRRLSMTDKLTGLWNRVMLDELLESKMLEYNRYRETYSVMILDVDHFKSVNDTYGHNVGDRVLVELANLLKATIWGNDAVGRWGGEEFLVLLSKTDAIQAKRVAEKIRTSVKKHKFPIVGKVTVSIGICEVNQKLSVLDVVDRSDQALYQAKANGRDQARIFLPGIPAKAKKSGWRKPLFKKKLPSLVN